MQRIKEHIKTRQFKPVYLLYGEEEYLKKLYRDKLKKAILPDDDGMNFSYFEGKDIDVNRIMEQADTLPFFQPCRLILIENSGLLKKQTDLADYLEHLPDTTHIIFVEQDLDKRNRLYKKITSLGIAIEMKAMDEKNLKLWISSILAKDNKKITEADASYLIQKCGTNMELLVTELEKLICYNMDKSVISAKDIDALCITHIEGKIFQMIDAIGNRNRNVALNLYYDLLSLREKPMSILFLITRHFNILLSVSSLAAKGFSKQDIASKASIPPFAVAKYMTQVKNFDSKKLKSVLESCIDTEEQIKTGLLSDTLGVELLIVKFSS